MVVEYVLVEVLVKQNSLFLVFILMYLGIGIEDSGVWLFCILYYCCCCNFESVLFQFNLFFQSFWRNSFLFNVIGEKNFNGLQILLMDCNVFCFEVIGQDDVLDLLIKIVLWVMFQVVLRIFMVFFFVWLFFGMF